MWWPVLLSAGVIRLSGGRRPPSLTTPGGKPVDPTSRCIEFESLGTQVRNTRRFFVMNPTNISYKYRWECEDGTGAAVAHLASAFKCVHKEGFVLSGKKSEMVFDPAALQRFILSFALVLEMILNWSKWTTSSTSSKT